MENKHQTSIAAYSCDNTLKNTLVWKLSQNFKQSPCIMISEFSR